MDTERHGLYAARARRKACEQPVFSFGDRHVPIERPRSRPLPGARVLSLLAVPAAVAWAAACSSSSKGIKADNPQEQWAGESRETEIKHEPCDATGKEVKTYKGDSNLASGKSFVTRVFDGGREVCSYADLNGDGNIDVFTYFGPDGRIRRREAAYTVGKAIDEIAVYANGELSIVMRETNFDGKLDTWDYYEGGKLVRRERDKTGDGRIDEWWSFEPGTENATIVQADVHTGKPDPTQTVKLGVGGGALGGLGAAKPSASAPVSDAGPKTTSTTPKPEAEVPSADAGTTDAGSDAGKPKPKGGK